MCNTFRRSVALFPALLLIALATPSHAITTFCVHDSQELQSALYTAANSSDTPILINIRKGIYDASAASAAFALVQVHDNQLIAISGGWSGADDACTNASRGATSTILVGTASRRALYLATSNANPHTGNQIFLSDLTITNPVGTGINSCLNASVTPNSIMTTERLHFDQCVSTDSALSSTVGYSNDGGTLTVNNVVARRGLGMQLGGIGVGTSGGGLSKLYHLSITANASAIDQSYVKSSGLLLYTTTNGRIEVNNSVVWGNTSDADTKDISVTGTEIYFNRVHYGGITGSAPTGNVSPTQGDPSFLASDDPHLRTDSPLVDSGNDSVTGGNNYDVEGRARLFGAHVDVGAYEWNEAIFADDFES